MMKRTADTMQQNGKEIQKQALKRMKEYQKKAEQMVSRKRMNRHMIRRG